MKTKIIIIITFIVTLSTTILWIGSPKKINASEIINLGQSNYKSITINDKVVKSETKNQYLIDDFIPKLSRFTLKDYDGKISNNYAYKVEIKSKDGSEITLLDNDYLIVNNEKYKILNGTIDLGKFYTFIE